MSAEKSEKTEKTLRAEVIEELKDFDVTYLDYVQRFIKILQHHDGCSSPAEAFIVRLVHTHTLGYPLTPDSVAGDLEEFRTDFESMIPTARHFSTLYKKFMEPAEPEPEPAA